MKVLLKGYSDLVHSYEHYLKIQEEEELRQRETLHRKHLEECTSDLADAERRGLEKGKMEGLVFSLLITLKTRFQSVPESLRESLFKLTSVAALEQLAEEAARCASLEEFSGKLSQITRITG